MAIHVQHTFVSSQNTLHINPLIEALAGHQLTHLFDVDMQQTQPTSPNSTLIVPFTVP